MLQHSSLPTTSTAEIADSLQRSWDRPTIARRWQALQDVLPLPVTWQQYLLACIVLAIVTGGLCLQVLLSVQIARSEFQLRQLRQEYAAVERRNSELVYAIAQQSSLQQMALLARQAGYVPATSRTYVLRSAAAPVFSSMTAGATATAAPAPATPAAGTTRSSATPGAGQATEAPWLAETRQWWESTQAGMSSAANQLWRDVTGRTE